RSEGILTGITGGATVAGALQIAVEAGAGASILCMLPDTGERYLSTPLFGDIPADMTAEELAIARSTPNYRFDVTPASAQSVSAPPPVLPEAEDFVTRAVRDSSQPVVMFALEWCEFC